MKNIILILLITFCCYGYSNAYEYAGGPNGQIASAVDAQVITDAAATHQKSRAVYIGTTQNLDFSFDGSTWVSFQGLTAGTIFPAQVVGARKTAGGAAPTSGDVIFLY